MAMPLLRPSASEHTHRAAKRFLELESTMAFALNVSPAFAISYLARTYAVPTETVARVVWQQRNGGDMERDAQRVLGIILDDDLNALAQRYMRGEFPRPRADPIALTAWYAMTSEIEAHLRIPLEQRNADRRWRAQTLAEIAEPHSVNRVALRLAAQSAFTACVAYGEQRYRTA